LLEDLRYSINASTYTQNMNEAMEPTILTLRLGNDIDEARAAITSTIEALLAGRRHAPRVQITLTAKTLPAGIISLLIAGLRQLREHGGAIELIAEHENVREAIETTGLDRVFSVPHEAAAETPKPKSAGRRAQGIVRVAAAAVAMLMAAGNAPAGAVQNEGVITDPAAILSRVIERNADLTSYQSRMHVDLRMTSFPFFREHLDGSSYFKRPDNYEVVFDHVPSFAKGFEKLYSDVGDPANWEKKFTVTYLGEHQFENRKDLELRMVQRVRGMIDHEIVLVDPYAWTVDKVEFHYYTGGTIAMTQHFSKIGNNTMIVSQDADIDIPHIKAVAHGTYDEYHTNVAIDDAIFTKNH
jgi:anti-anti-sigma regulatory factor